MHDLQTSRNYRIAQQNYDNEQPDEYWEDEDYDGENRTFEDDLDLDQYE